MHTTDHSIEEEVYLVTGATAGIGLATAQGLAQLGASVIMVGRNLEKGETLARRIQDETGNPAVEFLCADLSIKSQVRDLANNIRNSHPSLHVLVNNVGAFFLTRKVSADGIEATMALNYLNVFLLTNLFLDLLRTSTPSRVINVSSDAHRGSKMDFDDLEGKHSKSGMKAYGQSKLAMLLFTYELARRLQGFGVTVNALHPGFIASSMYDSSGGIVKLVAPIIKRMGKSPEEGADTVIYLATSPDVADISGKYFIERKPMLSSPESYDEAGAKRLWELSARLVGLEKTADYLP